MPGKVVLAERLIDDLWGETVPSTVRTALQGLVSDLRKRLEPTRRERRATAVLRTAPPGYRLAVEPRCVDANRFRRLLEEARAGEAAERAATLREALDLWRGPALADFTYEPFAQREIATLEELRLEAIEQRVDADLTLGLASELVADLEALVAEHPSRERLRGQLMLALYRTVRQADALEVYRDTAERWSRSWESSRPAPSAARAGDPPPGPSSWSASRCQRERRSLSNRHARQALASGGAEDR